MKEINVYKKLHDMGFYKVDHLNEKSTIKSLIILDHPSFDDYNSKKIKFKIGYIEKHNNRTAKLVLVLDCKDNYYPLGKLFSLGKEELSNEHGINYVILECLEQIESLQVKVADTCKSRVSKSSIQKYFKDFTSIAYSKFIYNHEISNYTINNLFDKCDKYIKFLEEFQVKIFKINKDKKTFPFKEIPTNELKYYKINPLMFNTLGINKLVELNNKFLDI